MAERKQAIQLKSYVMEQERTLIEEKTPGNDMYQSSFPGLKAWNMRVLYLRRGASI